ncbi:MAG: peptidylprolyl isomerase [Maricaulaceae bacterium]
MFGRIVREPLVQFLAAALVLFGLNALINPQADAPATGRIVVSEGRVNQIAEGFRLLSGRAPTEAELTALVDDFVQEEIAYREAVAMGLDADDTIVRRRMRQKLEFVLDDLDALEEPTTQDLQAWLDAHEADYLISERRAIRQVLASEDARGAEARAAATDFVAQLRAGAEPDSLTDTSLLPESLPLSTRARVAGVFGDGFADAVFASEEDGWFGPVSSAFGQHAVLIVDRQAARAPAVDEIAEQLRVDWLAARRAEAAAERDARLRERYVVEIDWPAEFAPSEPASSSAEE